MRALHTLAFLASICFALPAYAAWPSQLYPNDFDGDKISDACVWRPLSSTLGS